MKKLLILLMTTVLFLAACSLESPLKKDNEGKTNKKKSDITIGTAPLLRELNKNTIF